MDTNMTNAIPPRGPRPLPGLFLALIKTEPRHEPTTLQSTPGLIPDDGEDDWQDVYHSNPALPVAPALPLNEDDYIYIGSDDDLCLLYTSPSPRDGLLSRMPSSA